jgi:hypothetical protein
MGTRKVPMKIIICLFVFAIVSTIALFPVYAFTSANTGPKASGEGVSPISGRVVSNVKYELADNSSLIESVSLDLDGKADTVSIRLSTKSAMYATCSNVYGYHWQCDFYGTVRLADMDELRVIAVGN